MRLARARIFVALFALSIAGCHARSAPAAHAEATRSGKTSADRRTGRATAGEAGEPVEYVEYRVQPELGQISILIGSVEGARTAERVRRSAEALGRRGILVCTGDEPRAVFRTGTFNGHRIDTLIVALPPEDPEDPESAWSRWLLMNVDGHPKVECSLGDAGQESNLFVFGVQLFPDDDLLSISATDADGNELVVPEAACSLEDDTLITNDSFEEPADEAPDTEGEMLVKALEPLANDRQSI
jgi:hypothetical protein